MPDISDGAAFDDYAPDEPAPMTVFAISQNPDGSLGVDLCAATEMRFTLRLTPNDDYAQAIADICALAPSLMEADMNAMDGFKPTPAPHLGNIRTFVGKYRRFITEHNIAVGAFARLPERS